MHKRVYICMGFETLAVLFKCLESSVNLWLQALKVVSEPLACCFVQALKVVGEPLACCFVQALKVVLTLVVLFKQ